MAVGRYSPLSKVDYRFLSVVAKMFFLRKRDEVVWQFNVERCVEVSYPIHKGGDNGRELVRKKVINVTIFKKRKGGIFEIIKAFLSYL